MYFDMRMKVRSVLVYVDSRHSRNEKKKKKKKSPLLSIMSARTAYSPRCGFDSRRPAGKVAHNIRLPYDDSGVSTRFIFSSGTLSSSDTMATPQSRAGSMGLGELGRSGLEGQS